MNKTQQPSDRDFTDATDADALFDDEATVLAQPVVPLAANASDAPEEMTVVAGTPGAPASGLLTAARRPTMLALVLVSALVGVFIGGAGLYLFQRSRTAPAPPAASPAQQSAEAATTTTTAPVEHQQPAAQNSEQPPPAPQDSQPQPAPAAQTHPASVREQQPEAEHRREGEEEEEEDRADSQRRDRRRGRGRDDEEERDATLEQASERRRRRDGAIDTQAPIPDDASPASRRAARVEEALRRIENTRAARRARRIGVLN